jgi:signal transduction histidine kinase
MSRRRVAGVQSQAVDTERGIRLERVLALSRLSLSMLALIVLGFELPTATDAWVVARLIVAYTGYAFVVAVLVGFVPRQFLLSRIVHVADICWAVAIASATEGPGGTFFVFVVFVLVSAAYRGGLRHALFSGVATALLLLTSAAVLPLDTLGLGSPLGPDQLLIRCGYAMGLAGLIGYLAEDQNRSRAQAAATARVLAAVDLSGGLRTSVHGTLSELVGTLQAKRALMLFEDAASARVYRWALDGAGSSVVIDELSDRERQQWMFPLHGSSAAWCVRRRGRQCRVLSDARGTRELPASMAPAAQLEFDRVLLVIRLQASAEWRGRVLLVDPAVSISRRMLVWLAALGTQLGPALQSAYLIRRLRSRVTAMERSRLARELHDGVIQSLVGLEMSVDVLRRDVAAGGTAKLTALQRIQELLHDVVLDVRELMQQIRPVELSQRDLPHRLAEVTDRFRRDTGIVAQFVCVQDDPEVPPRLGKELVRITQEALVNVRKHSRANQVVVRFAATGREWSLTIDDDGRGYPFAGRYTLDELDAARRGPVVIKERIRSVRGSMLLESIPGRGSRLEISVPR